MSSLTTVCNNKYDEHVGWLENGRRRRAELTENEMVKLTYQVARWLLGAVSGSQSEQSLALAELEDIFDTTIVPPDNLVGSTTTELNTKRGKYALTSGSNTVVFSSALSSADYTLTFNCYTTAGGMNQWTYDESSKTVNGFDITVAANGYIEYIALSN